MTQHVFITAGGSGLGLAMAQGFLANGAKVAVTDIDQAMLDAAQSAHPDLICFHCDASDETAMHKVYESLRQSWDRLDVVIANAGIAGPTAAVENVSLDDWKRCLAVNLDGAFLATSLAPLDERSRRRRHDLNVIHGRAVWLSVPVSIRGGKMGDHWFDENLGHGTRPFWHPRQCHLPRRGGRRPHGSRHCQRSRSPRHQRG